MSSVFKEKWLWITILAMICIIVAPLIVVFVILNLPPVLRLVSMVAIVAFWGIAAAYKDWIKARREEGRVNETRT